MEIVDTLKHTAVGVGTLQITDLISEDRMRFAMQIIILLLTVYKMFKENKKEPVDEINKEIEEVKKIENATDQRK